MDRNARNRSEWLAIATAGTNCIGTTRVTTRTAGNAVLSKTATFDRWPPSRHHRNAKRGTATNTTTIRNAIASWIRNDRLIAVAVKAEGRAVACALADLQPNLVKNIEVFFSQYNRLRSRKFKPIGKGDRQEAERLIRQGMKAFRNRRRT
jgi:hypothetical protein